MPFEDGAVWNRLQKHIKKYKAESARKLGINEQQFMALVQFSDTGPYFATTQKLHSMLHNRKYTDYPPKPSISYRKVCEILHLIK
jgi:hypothetical protein